MQPTNQLTLLDWQSSHSASGQPADRQTDRQRWPYQRTAAYTRKRGDFGRHQSGRKGGEPHTPRSTPQPTPSSEPPCAGVSLPLCSGLSLATSGSASGSEPCPRYPSAPTSVLRPRSRHRSPLLGSILDATSRPHPRYRRSRPGNFGPLPLAIVASPRTTGYPGRAAFFTSAVATRPTRSPVGESD